MTNNYFKLVLRITLEFLRDIVFGPRLFGFTIIVASILHIVRRNWDIWHVCTVKVFEKGAFDARMLLIGNLYDRRANFASGNVVARSVHVALRNIECTYSDERRFESSDTRLTFLR